MIGRVKKVGSDILFHAITHGNVHDVIALLNDNEVDINCKNINGQTPLHVSIHPIYDHSVALSVGASQLMNVTFFDNEILTDVTFYLLVRSAS